VTAADLITGRYGWLLAAETFAQTGTVSGQELPHWGGPQVQPASRSGSRGDAVQNRKPNNPPSSDASVRRGSMM
jgi:hypothetical protein